jgi:hypothetical protein
MREYRFNQNSMQMPCILSVIMLFSLSATVSALAAEVDMGKIMPVPACAEGWTIDGKVTLYDKDTLFDRINGESELYFPYGFDMLAYARYANKQNPQIAIDADIYRMGSRLDAFGMFANYRKKDDTDVVIGAEATVSTSQLFFYQDRFFVRLQVTGTTSLKPEIFLACAGAISRNLPKTIGRPKELEILMVPSVVKKSERYVAQSLLGYDFFRRGIIADAVQDKALIQVFMIIEQSSDASRRSIEQYRSYLKLSGSNTRVVEANGGISLEANDPLYGTVLIEQADRFVIGAARINNLHGAKLLIKQLRTRIDIE